MSEVMIDETKARLRAGKHLAETIFAAALVPHAGEMARGIEQSARIHGLLVRHITIQIMEKSSARTRPSLAQEIHLLCAHSGKIEARAYRKLRESSVVLDAAEALLSDREKHFAVARDARRRIVHLRIINSQRNHICRISA